MDHSSIEEQQYLFKVFLWMSIGRKSQLCCNLLISPSSSTSWSNKVRVEDTKSTQKSDLCLLLSGGWGRASEDNLEQFRDLLIKSKHSGRGRKSEQKELRVHRTGTWTHHSLLPYIIYHLPKYTGPECLLLNWKYLPFSCRKSDQFNLEATEENNLAG